MCVPVCTGQGRKDRKGPMKRKNWPEGKGRGDEDKDVYLTRAEARVGAAVAED